MKKVLVIDDELTILLSLQHLLSSRDVTVVTCGTVEEAEYALSRYAFDLVIADIRLSGIDGIEGLEILSHIKKENPETHVIIMTAYGSTEMEAEAYRRGAFHYFEKPIDLALLADKAGQLGINLGRG